MIELSRTRSLSGSLAIALAELRTLRRLARTWVIVALAAGLVGSAFYFHSYSHHSFPGSVSRIELLPRFAWADINNYVLWLFMAAVVSLAFDTRHRDEQSGIREALDSRPVSNLGLFAGRLCGVAVATLAALFAVSVLLQVAATVGGAIGWAVYPIEPVAMLTFLLVDAIPALVAWCAMVLLLVAVLGNRLVVAIVALPMLGLHMWAEAHVPVYLLPAVSLLHIHDNWASDLAPRFADAQTYLHRGSLILVGGGLLVWTAALHGRPDGVSRTTRGLFGALLVVLGFGGIGTVALRCIDDLDLRATWLAAHEQMRNSPIPLVRHVSGVVHINPGRELGLDLEMQLTAPPHIDLPALVFSFNPGLKVAALRVDNEATPYAHELGLLNVELPEPLAAGSPVTLAVQAEGLPDADFAYLDSTIDWRVKTVRNQILRLGTSAGVFASRYVALMPALRWLPVPGPNLDGGSRGNLPTIDLSVAVPDGWLVAGPGRREADDAGRFRFRPGAPVPETAIIAGRFERRAVRIAGVDLELLFHPDHLGTVAALADTRERLESRLTELLGQAEELGIPYPYDGYSLVEVPTHLREYGGGWALDSVMELPGVLLLKEHGFPYANFRFDDDPAFPSDPESLAQLKWVILQGWFHTPNPGANAAESVGRNLTTVHTHAMGPGASALDEIVEELAASLLDDDSIPFSRAYSVYWFDVEDDIGIRLMPMVRFLSASTPTYLPGFGSTLPFPGRPNTWERLLGASLADLDMRREPGTAVEARSLRVEAAFRSIGDSVGRQSTARFLAALRNRHTGAAFDADDFDDAAAQAGIDLGALLGDWISEVALPGFVTSHAGVSEIADREGNVRFQTLVHVRNGEGVPGLVRLSTGDYPATVTDPIQIPGNTTMELGMVTDDAPAQLWLEPYLALNRAMVWIDIVNETSPQVPRPLTGARPSVWLPPVEGVVVDDLDSGFAVERRGGQHPVADGSRQTFGGNTADLDQGLPGHSTTPGEWYRVSYPTSWGRYRHTAAGAPAGDGSQVAVFAADLPAPGRWRLDFYLPDPQPPLGKPFLPASRHLQHEATGQRQDDTATVRRRDCKDRLEQGRRIRARLHAGSPGNLQPNRRWDGDRRRDPLGTAGWHGRDCPRCVCRSLIADFGAA
ncbi:MAG: hypothetical protein OXH68_08955 [Gammaproteobacteria bacterium]|nr:hypothetical protein [Gammaproteobacteria bacterium]